MKRKILIAAMFLFACKFIFAQVPTIQWQKSFGGSSYDYTAPVIQTSDGGFILAGTTASNDGDVSGMHGVADLWVIKIDSVGTLLWQKCLGGSDYDDAAYVEVTANILRQTSDGGYVVTGTTYSNDGDVSGNHSGDADMWVAKLDNTGNLQWQKCLGGTNDDYGNAVQQTTDGGYIVAGYCYSNDGDVTGNHGLYDYWIVKLSSSGAILWKKCFGGSDEDYAEAIQQTSDGGYIVAGYTWSNDGDVTGNHGLTDNWVIKIDSSGILQWQKCLGGGGNERAVGVQQTSDGGYLINGWTGSSGGDVNGNHGSDDCWIVKLNNAGILQWQKCLGSTTGEGAYSIEATSDGGYIIAASSYGNNGDVNGNHGNSDIWVVKVDNIGTLQWQKSLGGTGDDFGFSALQTADGGYIVAGVSESNDGDVTGNHGSQDAWVVKLTFPVGMEQLNISSSFNVYPNPVTNILDLKTSDNSLKNLSIHNLLGEEIMNENFSLQTYSVNVSWVPNGIYIAEITNGKNIVRKKFVKQ